MVQNYLDGTSDVDSVPLRLYYLGNYLLLKGQQPESTYLCYFKHSALEWYPEWAIELGMPMTPIAGTVSELQRPGGPKGIFERRFEQGLVMVNPTPSAISVVLPEMMHLVTPTGGGAVGKEGTVTPAPALTYHAATTVVVPSHSAAILLNSLPQ